MTNYLRRSRVSQNRRQSARRSIRQGGNPPGAAVVERPAPFVARVETPEQKRARLELAIQATIAKLGDRAILRDGITEAAAIRHLRSELADLPKVLFKQPYRPEGCKLKVSPPKGSRANGTTSCVSTTALLNEPQNCYVNEETNRCRRS
jgi:hypothetical protein